MIREKIFPLRGRRPRSGNVFENHFLNRDNLGKMQLKTRKNGSSSIKLEHYMKQMALFCFPVHFQENSKFNRKKIFFLVQEAEKQKFRFRSGIFFPVEVLAHLHSTYVLKCLSLYWNFFFLSNFKFS